jgi:hypothetical protein
LKTVTLTLAFGITQFEKQFGGPAAAFPRLRFAATRLQEMFNHLISPKMSRGPINLSASSGQKLHYAYEQAAIVSFPPYIVEALPSEEQLVADLRELVALYAAIASDPLDVTVERLVEAAVQTATQLSSIKVQEFQPRERKKNAPSSKKDLRRYSPESRKVGDAGERIVIKHERERLSRAGRQDLADRVRWHAQQLEFPGWDVTSFADDGREVFIEVKSSVGKTVSSVNLTANEWDAACDPSRRDRYFIYLVTNALSSAPIIERLANPASLVDEGKITCEPIVYVVDLRSPVPVDE